MSEEQQVAEVASTETVPAVAPSESDDWKTSLPEDLASDPNMQHITSVEAMAKSYINAQKMVGAEKVAVPGSWATEEDWDGVYNKLGRPETPNDYDLTLPDEANEDFVSWFKETSHGVGLNDKQAQQLAAAYAEYAESSGVVDDASIEQRRSEAEKTMRSEVGRDFDVKLQQVNDLLSEFKTPDLSELQMADGTLLGDSPDMMRFFFELNDYMRTQIGEDKLPGRDSRPGVSEADLEAKLSTLQATGSPYWEKMHPDHDRVVKEVLHIREQLTE